MQKITGIALVIGSVIFLIAAFSPVSRIYGISDGAKRLGIILQERKAWELSQLLFAAGALAVAAGMVLFYFSYRDTGSGIWALSGALALAAGACFLAWHCYLRGLDPQAFVSGNLPGWHFMSYTLLTQAGLIAIGFAVLSTGLPGWTGWMLAGGSFLFLLAYVIFKDVPPFFYYLLTLVAGVVVLRAGFS